MGEQFIKKHTEQFLHQQDAAFQEVLKTQNLFFEKPEVYNIDYPCRTLIPDQVQVGMQVIVQANANGSIEVTRANQVIGVIEGSAASQILCILRSDPRAGNMMKARVISQQLLSGKFNVRCAEE